MMTTMTRRRPRRIVLGVVCLVALHASCGEGEGPEPNPDWVPLWNPSSGAVCSVKVSGGNYASVWGWKKVETDYLPRVLWCEVGVLGRDPEFLEAMAIAARTFLYKRLSWRSSMRNSTSDQVYYAAHCKSRPHQAYYDAVARTAGVVMLKSPGGALHHGYYRAGKNACSSYGYCDGQPCLGQRNAAACARAGYDWRAILNRFYQSPTIHHAAGSCTNGSGTTVDPDQPQSCYYGGVRGVCQATSETCAGSYRQNLCNGPAEVQCCLPPDGSYGSCAVDGKQGSCQQIGQACAGSYRVGLCPGPSDIQCCVPNDEDPTTQPDEPVNEPANDEPANDEPAATEWGSCEYAGRAGTCQQTSQACAGSYQTGLCPGPSDVRCCVSWGSCTHDGQPGTCQKTSQVCAGTFHAGLCPGPSDVRCCVE